ncbi:unnamed protein product [Rodentolepis nana]|uniref:DNK domain-containing protein n=1 Tax=Rodentolepis nana TaxID=102285 RepID=A0A0R3TCU4_RODNA|nr:unnamed protein product [Rodentolepis nana]
MDTGRKIKVAVEGNIGCGKSTFLKYFGEYSSNIQISPEPIELWNNVQGFKLFEVFYGNPKRWSTAFQSQVMVTMLNRQAEKQIAPVRILERSVSSCRYIFIEAMNRNGQLSNADLDVFDRFYSYGRSLPISDLDLIVYLRCMPEVCASRIRERDRKGESNISMDYLNQLHDLHEEWLIGGKLEPTLAPVLIFDCNEPLETLRKTYFENMDRVLCGVTV